MPDPPSPWPSLCSSVLYDDAGAAIDWLCEAFGFAVKLRVDGPDGCVEHSELVFGDGVVLVGNAGGRTERGHFVSPRSVEGANTQSLCVRVSDVDAQCERARAAGATIVIAPATQDYGAEYGAHRTFLSEDPEGHRWWFPQVLRDPGDAAD